jgi:hypothetical protein
VSAGCIAAQIELLLLRSVVGEQRKPTRRALREQDIEVTVGTGQAAGMTEVVL